MSEDADELPARERARVRHRDRKVRGPRMVVDNAGLKKLTVHLAEKLRRRPRPPAKPPAGSVAGRRRAHLRSRSRVRYGGLHGRPA